MMLLAVPTIVAPLPALAVCSTILTRSKGAHIVFAVHPEAPPRNRFFAKVLSEDFFWSTDMVVNEWNVDLDLDTMIAFWVW